MVGGGGGESEGAAGVPLKEARPFGRSWAGVGDQVLAEVRELRTEVRRVGVAGCPEGCLVQACPAVAQARVGDLGELGGVVEALLKGFFVGVWRVWSFKAIAASCPARAMPGVP